MPRDTGLANRLRSLGLYVIEVDGWQSRGSSDFHPHVSVNHHTAGSASGTAPSLNTCIYGRPDLDGPLCNVMQDRQPDQNDRFYVIAAGRANHAGSGGWAGYSGNSNAWGLEIEHTGTSPLSGRRQDLAARCHLAMYGGHVGNVCQHFEWAPGRKIDAATGVNPDDFRGKYWLQQGGAAPSPGPTPPPSGGVPPFPFPAGHWMGVESSNPKNHSGAYAADRPGIQQYQGHMHHRGWDIDIDGIFGPQSRDVTISYQREKGLAADGLAGEATWHSIYTAPVT